ncbi:hypothetical protein ABZX62_20255 [Streptomyces flavidovirens]|uniref:hypothetical protein n=1 Tax=Streptomyces flavidovirens TaxID=67298 RepID=UPI0033A66AE4
MPAFLLRHEVTVEEYLGSSAYGPRYATPVTVRCLLEQKTRTVRDQGGEEVTSTSTFRAPLDTASVAPESRVTLPDGDTTTVIAALRHDGGGLPVPDHLEVQLR